METNYDAIVVGTGISGGWAAKELCEKGLKTLVLERGPMVKHIEDYPTMNDDPWDYKTGDIITNETRKTQGKQSRTEYTTRESSKHFFVNDLEPPNKEIEPISWMRGYHVGGRSLTWGRQSYRLTDFDFEANIKDGIAIDWPIRYKDLAPWYNYVEEYIGVSGQNVGLPQFPDGNYLKAMELNCVEDHLRESISKNYKDRILTIGRTAIITEGTKPGLGRMSCQYRARCMRGCPFGAYFSSNSSTLPAAEKTGNMTLRPNSIVHEVIYDSNNKKASGVRVIDTETKKTYEFNAKVIFLCASAVASTSILMQSKSDAFPNGLGNSSDQLGRNIMDHHLDVGASAKTEDFKSQYYFGRRNNGIYIPRFRNIGGSTNRKDFLRGYGYQGGGSRNAWTDKVTELSYGTEFKKEILKPGMWSIGLGGFGEVLPYEDNRMTLDYEKLDNWGLPTVTFNATIKENELNMRKDMKQQAMEMLENAGFKDVEGHDDAYAIGLGIHEMGTARMGHDARSSVLNKYNQVHEVPNIFVTDGSAMTSAGNVNPSLTYMALTARAADHAVKELKKMNI